MALDHGMLNVPLSKRGNFHKELDEFISSQKPLASENHFISLEANRKARGLAIEGFKQIDADLLKAEAAKRGIKASELKRVLKDLCSDRPQRALQVIPLFVKREAT